MAKRGRKKGYVMDDETKAKISAALRGRPKTIAHKRATSRALRGNPRHRAGVTAAWARMTPEERRAIALRGHETRRRGKRDEGDAD